MPDSGKFKDLYLNSAHTYPCQGIRRAIAFQIISSVTPAKAGVQQPKNQYICNETTTCGHWIPARHRRICDFRGNDGYAELQMRLPRGDPATAGHRRRKDRP